MKKRAPMYQTDDTFPRPPRERTRFEKNQHPDRTTARSERASLGRHGPTGATRRSANHIEITNSEEVQ